MAYGNNTVGEQPRSHFQEAGGSIIKFKHPYLVGQISGALDNLDEIDISKSCKLADTYLQATPNQDSAVQEVMVDGSTVTITNRLMNGTLQLPIIPGSGLVSSGDFIAALHLIQSVGDTVGGIITMTEHINGLAITTIWYGVTPKNVPHKIKMGMGVPSYNCTLTYSGWVQAVSKSTKLNTKGIWATGNKEGVQAAYSPYGINAGETGNKKVSIDVQGISSDYADQTGKEVAIETAKIVTNGNDAYKNASSIETIPLEPNKPGSNENAGEAGTGNENAGGEGGAGA